MTFVLFDVDGVLIHGYHAKPELQKCWDEDLEKDFGIKREVFKSSFIHGIFEKDVLIGKCDLYSALKRKLPQMGYNGEPQNLIEYWMKKDANVNNSLMPYIKTLSETSGVSLYIATNQEDTRAQYLM